MAVSSDLWKRLALLLALVKVGAGLVALYVSYGDIQDPVYPYILHLFYATPYLVAGLFLIAAGRRDPRAVDLGGFFLIVATSFVNRPLRTFVEHGYSGAKLLQAVDVLELDAFMAFFLWSFARDFPHPLVSPAGQRNIRWAVRASLAAGLALFGLNVANYIVLLVRGKQPLAELVPMRGQGLYYSALLPLLLAAFGFLIWRGVRLRGEEQRRIRLFLLSFGLAVPPLTEILAGLFIVPYRDFVDERVWLGRDIVLVHLILVGMLPILATYAVLVHQVLDVKLLARRVLQYALARYSVMALAAVPMAFLAVYLYENREEKLSQFFTGPQLPLLGSVALVGLAALRYRKTLLEAIDRRYFREQYDARRILTQLQDHIRATSGTAALASLIAHEVDLALHLEGISVMVLDARCGVLSDPRNRGRRLDASSHLALLVANNSDPLMIDLGDSRSPLARLPNEDRHWLVDSGFRMIVPILARDGSLLGLIGLGEKRSGLPFLKEDRDLLRAIASSSAWIVELEQTTTPSRPKRPKRIATVPEIAEVEEDDTVAEPIALAEMAKECPTCNRLYPSYTVLCSACSKRLETSHVPYVLPGKFRFEKRIGIGGMGVVYRGSDLALGRQVAVKTLRRVSPEDAMRLRREARTAAAVSHPHLAPVYGMETWQGTPMLVLELLEGGTLAHRLLEHGRLTPVETIDLGIAMCDALGQLHAADILHRDIKPSNIGYNRDGVPKLMDFGIARMMYDLRREREGGERERLEEDPSLVPSSSIWTPIDGITPRSKPLVGTLSYLCPEALEGRTPDSLFDLWSLAIVLYECLLGRKVFSSSDPRQTAARIRVGRVPDLRQLCPEYEEPLADFFRIALHRSRGRRPASAQELRHALQEVGAKLA